MSEMHGTVTYEAGQRGTPPRDPGRGRAALPLTPARRVALLIGVPVCLALTGFAALNVAALIGRGHVHFSHAFPASAKRLSVTDSGGNVLLEQAAAGPARLSGTGYYSLIRPNLTESTSAGSATFGYPCELPVGDCGLNMTVSVPARTAVTISTGGGDLTASGLIGNVSLSTGGGNLTATDVTGNASLQTGGGDVTAIRLTGDIDLGTGGGNITATSIDSPRVTADSGGGDIEIVFTRVPQDVQVSADGGNVTIVVPAGTATYDVTASAGGGGLSDSVPQATSSPRKITASSGGGDITIQPST